MIAHEFLAPGEDVRCIYCGTKQGHHALAAQPCVPRHGEGEALRPEPARRGYASEDFDTIGARVAELDAERIAAMNEPAKD